MEYTYKVVRVVGEKYVSAVQGAVGVQVEYRIGERALPPIPNSKLFVFEEYSFAVDFRDRILDDFDSVHMEYAILLCEAEGVTLQTHRSITSTLIPLMNWWKRLKDERGGWGYQPTPIGTRGCDSLIPIGVVTE